MNKETALTPAELGEMAARRDAEAARKRVFMAALIDGFKDFVLDAIDDGIADEYDDHVAFLDAAYYTWKQAQEDEV